MGSGFSKMKKQAKLFEAQYEKIQEDLRTLEATGSAGNELVTITLTGEHQMKSIVIQPECIDPNDPEGLQDLILAAHKEAVEKIAAKNELEKRNLPGFPT